MADEIAWRRKWKPDFETQPWQVITVSNITYLTKYYFEEASCSYEIAITDYKRVWFEAINQSVFADRAKKLNPNVEAQRSYLLNQLHGSLCNSSSSTNNFKVKQPGENERVMTVRLKTKLPAGVPFFWEFYCSLQEGNMMKEQFVLPLLSMVGELQRRQMELFKLLKKKDYEIQEYKTSGAVLSRKAFVTLPFNEDTFVNKTTVSEGFLGNVINPGANACNKESHELYKQVMIKKKWLDYKNNPDTAEDEIIATVDDLIPSAAGDPSLSSWDTKLPPSLIGEMESSPVNHSPVNSPHKSPNKLSSPVQSPSKDDELKRRENLRKRLEDEAEKKKQRKKRKLKL